MAPINACPLLFLTFPILVWLIDGIGGRGWSAIVAAASIGWWFGFGYFLAGLYWIGHAFLVDAKTFGWLLPFAVVALPAERRPLTQLSNLVSHHPVPAALVAVGLGVLLARALRH